MGTIAVFPGWTESREVVGRSGGASRTVYNTFFPEGVPGQPQYHQIHIVCVRVITNPRMPKHDRRRYRFEWHAKVWGERDAVLGDGHLMHESCVGRTSDECKRAVAAYVKEQQA